MVAGAARTRRDRKGLEGSRKPAVAGPSAAAIRGMLQDAARLHERVAGESVDDLTPRIQEVHRTLIHAVCDAVEQRIDRNA